MRRRTPKVGALLLLACLTLTAGAHAADSSSVVEASAEDKKAAGELYTRAMERFDDDDLETALKGFRESYERVKSPNSRFMIARTLARLGRNVEAYLEMEAVISEAETLGSKYAETASAARAKQEEIRARVGLVTITLEGAPKGTTVQVGEETLAPGRLGKPYPVLPGETSIRTKGPTGKEDSRVVTVAAGESTKVDARIRETPVEAVVEISHDRYVLDVGVHAVGESLQPSNSATRGAGLGVRVGTELLHGGLVLGIDDNIALGGGADWIGTSTEPHTWLHASFEWGIWLAPRLSLMIEPGAGVMLGSGTHLRPVARIGGRYRIWDRLHVVARLGIPDATLGVAYLR